MLGQCATKFQRSIVFGFLSTYAALLSSETDFLLAQELGLLPHELTTASSNKNNSTPTTSTAPWITWRILVKQLLLYPSTTPSPSPTTPNSIYTHIHRRNHYGELRLSRLNAITLFTRHTHYLPPWPDYTSFLRSQLAWLAATTIYIVLVLAAMQVGLATCPLQGDKTYMRAAYGFSIFAILGPLVGVGLVVGCFGVVVVGVNWVWQGRRARGRFGGMLGRNEDKLGGRDEGA
ncbi:hypothetical protein BDV19DRAFT_384727 [Aspergillus venezuelensis]